MQMTGLARLGRDAELRNSPQGEPVLNLALAFNYGKKDGNGKKPTQWVDASIWGDRAAKLAEYMTKGRELVVTLEDPHVHTYTKGDGSLGSTIRARLGALEFTSGTPQQDAAAPARAPAPRPAPAPAPRAASSQTSGNAFADMDDDIPF